MHRAGADALRRWVTGRRWSRRVWFVVPTEEPIAAAGISLAPSRGCGRAPPPVCAISIHCKWARGGPRAARRAPAVFLRLEKRRAVSGVQRVGVGPRVRPEP